MLASDRAEMDEFGGRQHHPEDMAAEDEDGA